jgi:uncharacterized protein (TIGR00251 family)
MTGPIRAVADGTTVRVRVVPGARATELAGVDGGVLRVRVAAPPVEGKANRALLAFLAARLGVRPRALRVLVGEHARDKVVLVEGVAPEAVGHALLPG